MAAIRRSVYGFDPGDVRRQPRHRRQESRGDPPHPDVAAARRPPTQRAVLNAEQVIKTKCSKCHDIERAGKRIAAKPPEIPTRWLLKAKFTHTSIAILRASRVTKRRAQSTNTSDV